MTASTITMATAPAYRSRVCLSGLQSATELNGAIGTVIGEPDAETGRIPVKLMGPLAQNHPTGIKAKVVNVTLLPPQRAVRLEGLEATELQLSPSATASLHGQALMLDPDQQLFYSGGSWLRCQVPELLGIPLVLKQLAPADFGSRPSFEEAAVLMLRDPESGLAPPWVQLHGLGPVLLARTDGKDFTTKDLWQLHDYHRHLNNMYPEWGQRLEPGHDNSCSEQEIAREREAALSLEAFASFTQHRAEELSGT